MQDQNCTAPVDIECEDACVFGQYSNGIQIRDCAYGDPQGWMDVAFAELNDNEKKCKKFKNHGSPVEVCYCNYDGCNENLANPTSLASLTLLASLMLALTI